MTSTAASPALQIYDGPFGPRQAAHLLRRTTFGVTPGRIDAAVKLGLRGSLEKLFAPRPVGEPVNTHTPEDPNVAIGDSWIGAPYSDAHNVYHYRQRTLRSWQLMSYYRGGFALQPKMAFFWHNHFGVYEMIAPEAYYSYLRLVYDEALGNFKRLVTKVTIEPAMLKFLNGHENRVGDPNENYARELLELYTVGRGPQVGPGDYTNYTEQDVRAIANALTGWQITNMRSQKRNVTKYSKFEAYRHDESDQKLSRRFANHRLRVSGPGSYLEVMDVVFRSRRAAEHVARKLYRFFVYYKIGERAEREVIQPMATMIVEAKWDIAPALRALFGSKYFYSPQKHGCLIKGPLEFVGDAIANLKFPLPRANDEVTYKLYFAVFRFLKGLNMTLQEPPSVAGFKAYHQAPSFNRDWINASTLGVRARIIEILTGEGIEIEGKTFKSDLLRLLEGFDDPSDPNALVRDMVAQFTGYELTEAQRDGLKDVLIPGLPDFEWTVEYGSYLADPTNRSARISVSRKVTKLVEAVLNMPEFQLF